MRNYKIFENDNYLEVHFKFTSPEPLYSIRLKKRRIYDANDESWMFLSKCTDLACLHLYNEENIYCHVIKLKKEMLIYEINGILYNDFWIDYFHSRDGIFAINLPIFFKINLKK